MGCPVNSIRAMEESLRHRRQKLVIVLLASANSDSRAVDFVLRNFHEMDIISDDVDFYMPGYGINKYNRNANIMDSERLSDQAREMYPDFHSVSVEQQRHIFSLFRPTRDNDSQCPIVIDSPRLGGISFNVAEFTDFVMEFSRRIDGFHYLGGCQMVLLEPKEDGTPNYGFASVYDLDSIVNSSRGLSLDAFLHRMFQIVRDSCCGDNFAWRNNNVLSILFGHRSNRTEDVIKKIDALYYEATRTNEREERYEIIINNIILDMNNCLNWDIRHEEFYFISYSSRNVMQAETLKILLQHHKIHVWIAPDGIPQGREYPIVIPTALKLAKVFVLLLTPDSAKSPWVKRELAIAIGNSVNTKVKVLFSEGMTIDDVRANNELGFLLDQVQVKFNYNEIVHSTSALDQFILE